MSNVTEPILLDKTGRELLEEMKKQSSIMTAIAGGYNYKPTSIEDVFAIVRAGLADKTFDYGDQIILPWTDQTTGQTYDVPWDVVHFGDVTLEDGEVVPGMFLQWHYATPFGVQFDQYEAFYYAEEELPAGTYYITVGANWGTHCKAGETYYFVLTQPVPAGGQLCGFYGMPDRAPAEWKVYSFSDKDSMEPLETVAVVAGTKGTLLGNFVPAGEGNINSLHRLAYGYNRWSQSAMRQWLNSDADINEWWTPQHDFDRAPDQLMTKAGFLSGLDEEFLKRLKKVKVITHKNTVTDDGEQDITYDKIFLPSLEAMFINPQLAGEDEVWEYWKRASGRTEIMAQYQTYPQIRTFAIENHNSPQSVRLRSAHRGNSCNAWYVNSSGYVYSYYHGAIYAHRCAPACVIC